MASNILAGMRIVELSAFVAAPLGGLSLAQLGAEVIRIDPIDGPIDHQRWPLSPEGASLYWAGLNKGKQSVQLDLRRREGQEIAAALIAAPGDGGGICLTNLGGRGWASYEALKKRRADVIQVSLSGNPDGSTALDYTINSAVGFPYLTGSGSRAHPVNHVMPVWDVAAGLSLALGILAAERHRRITGEGQLVSLSLADAALATISHLGYIAEAQLVGDRPNLGNHVYGTFGHDFATADGRRVMVTAFTTRQWQSVVEVTGLGEHFAALARDEGLDLLQEADRFRARDAIAVAIAEWCGARSYATVSAAFEEHKVCWGPYQSVRELAASDPRCSLANPLFGEASGPGIGKHLTAGSPLAFSAAPRQGVEPVPVLGSATAAVLTRHLGMSDGEIARLRADRIVS